MNPFVDMPVHMPSALPNARLGFARPKAGQLSRSTAFFRITFFISAGAFPVATPLSPLQHRPQPLGVRRRHAPKYRRGHLQIAPSRAGGFPAALCRTLARMPPRSFPCTYKYPNLSSKKENARIYDPARSVKRHLSRTMAIVNPLLLKAISDHRQSAICSGGSGYEYNSHPESAPNYHPEYAVNTHRGLGTKRYNTG